MRAVLAAASTCTLLSPVPLSSCAHLPRLLAWPRNQRLPEEAWLGARARRSIAPATPGAARPGISEAGLHLVPSAVPDCGAAAAPGRACWRVSSWCESTTRGGLGPWLLQLQRKKEIVFFGPSEILSCCFAEVGACAALCLLKSRSALGVLRSAHRPHNLAARAHALVRSRWIAHRVLRCGTSARLCLRDLALKCY